MKSRWMKSHWWAKKRFKVTKTWKVLFKKSCNNHLLTNKWKNNKKSPYWKELASVDIKKIKNLLHY